jgi:tetratricopeptide (TPR) repeat protein
VSANGGARRTFETARLDEIERRGEWIPIRRHFGIAAFGVNAWTGDDGDSVIGPHDERQSGHEELYVVLSGRAEFRIGDETVDAPAGTIVFVRDAAVRRGAEAREAGTTVLTVGAKPGAAFSPSVWEENADIVPLFGEGRYEEAAERLRDAHRRHPEAGGILYNLACAEARLGNSDEALLHLARAVEIESRFAEIARDDEDLASIRDDPRFPAQAA